MFVHRCFCIIITLVTVVLCAASKVKRSKRHSSPITAPLSSTQLETGLQIIINNTNKSKSDCVPGDHDVIPSSPVDDNTVTTTTTATTTTTVAPEKFTVRWKTTANTADDIIVEIIRQWSPIGVDRFYQLINDNYYNCAAFFRVVPSTSQRNILICVCYNCFIRKVRYVVFAFPENNVCKLH
jgi:hypothetical protein